MKSAKDKKNIWVNCPLKRLDKTGYTVHIVC